MRRAPSGSTANALIANAISSILRTGVPIIATALQMGDQMISFFSLKSVCGPLVRGAKWVGLVAGAAVAACAGSPVFAEAPGKIPDLGSSSGFAWTPLTINGGIGAAAHPTAKRA
jgi:hypothetical protein